MKAVNAYLNFSGNTEDAFKFYRTVFGGEFAAVVRFRDFGEAVPGLTEVDADKIAHIALPLGPSNMLMGTDVLESLGQSLKVGNNSFIVISAESAEEAHRLFDALAHGGRVEMPLQKTEWSENYGICADPFGVQWMIDHTGGVQFSPHTTN